MGGEQSEIVSDDKCIEGVLGGIEETVVVERLLDCIEKAVAVAGTAEREGKTGKCLGKIVERIAGEGGCLGGRKEEVRGEGEAEDVQPGSGLPEEPPDAPETELWQDDFLGKENQ